MSSPTLTSEEVNAGRNSTAATSPAQQIQPYLFFGGRCEEALEFYRRVLGAEVTMLMRFKDSPEAGNCSPAVSGDRVMHASLQIRGTTLLASDGCEGPSKFEGFALSLPFTQEADAERVFAALAEGGQVQQPLIPTFFAKTFGIVADRFGVCWMVLVPAQP